MKKINISRRKLFSLFFSAIGITVLSKIFSQKRLNARTRPKVLILGMGVGGATCLNYMYKLNELIEIIVIEKSRLIRTGAFSNLVIGNILDETDITFGMNHNKYKNVKFIYEVVKYINYEKKFVQTSNDLRINFGSLIPHTLFNTVRYLGDYLCLEEFYVSDEEFKSYEYLLKLSKEEKKKKYDDIIDTICYFLENYPYYQLLRCWASPSSVFISGSKKLLKTFNEKCKHFRYLVNEFRGENFCCPFVLQAPHFVSSYENVEVLEYMHKEMKLDIKDHYQSFIWLCISFERFEYLEYAIKLDYPIEKSFMENLYDDEELNKKKFYNRESMSKIDKINKFINICNKYNKVFL